MRRINWDKNILGADGITRTRGEIEAFFLNEFENKIRQNLNNLSTDVDLVPSLQHDIVIISRLLRMILLAQPQRLVSIKNRWILRKQAYLNELALLGLSQDDIDKRMARFNKKILDAFNYDGFRDAKLNRLAVVLNVKSCLYCNQQYTIALGKTLKSRKRISLWGSDAYIQFDHFFNKSKCPILSMSLYNLIPSCPLCNQKKSANDYSLQLHPYVENLNDKIHFRIKDPKVLISPFFNSIDLLEVEIETKGNTPAENNELKKFVENLELERRYARHLDIVKELECAKYLDAYYNSNITVISQDIADKIKAAGFDHKAIAMRHFKGFYDNPDDINKRPLSKFCQDIYDQLIVH